MIRILLIVAFLFVNNINVNAQVLPEPLSPPKLVTDFGDMLETNEEVLLENKLVAFDERSTTQIAVVTVPNLDGGEIGSYSFQLAEKWGIGQKGSDNGVLMLVAKEERQIFIATGYGLEDVIPDAIAKRIIERDILPLFRQGRVYDGLNLGTDQLIDLSDGKVFEDSQPEPRGDSSWVIILIIFGSVAFFISLPFLIMYIAYRRSKYPKQGKSFWKYFSENSSSGSGGSSGSSWSSGGSSSSYSSGSSSSSSSGSSFGGFGGGSFGGGGAGGSW